MTSVLVSGGAGFLGSHVVDMLLQRPDVECLVVVDNLWTGTLSNLDHIVDPRLKLDIGEVENYRSDLLFDEIYHLASPATPRWYMQEPERTISANLIGAMRLRELLKPNGRICFTSTSEVYGEAVVSPQPESYRGSVDCTGPRSSYDEGKRCTEAFLFETNRLRGVDVRVARVFNVYGPRTRADDGRAVSNFISQVLTGRPITIFGDGMQSRSWGYVDDILEGLSRFFWRDQITHFSGPLNIGNDRELSVLAIAQHICSLVPNSKIVHVDGAPQDPFGRCPDLTLARRVLPEWQCNVLFEDGSKRTLDWFRDRLLANDRSRFPELR